MEKCMCKQEQALNILKQTGKSLPKNSIIMFEAQVEDFKKMESRMKKVEEKVDTLITDVADVKENMSKMLEILEMARKPILRILIENKYFWWCMLILVTAITGLSVTEVGQSLLR